MIIRVEIKLVLFSLFSTKEKVRHPFLPLIRQIFHSFYINKILKRNYWDVDYTFKMSYLSTFEFCLFLFYEQAHIKQTNKTKENSKAANFPNDNSWDIANLMACSLNSKSKIFKWYSHMFPHFTPQSNPA